MSTPNTESLVLEQALSTVTAILPKAQVQRVLDALSREAACGTYLWDARGTLLHEAWYKQLLPSISPAKVMLQLLIPDNEVDRILDVIVNVGKLHLQSTGAVYCTPCDDVYMGADFKRLPMDQRADIADASHDLHENLDVITYIVEPNRTDAVARAAIRAGSHGPIVHFGEGRGLRDRLGWLRITKQAVKEVITVIADSADADAVFAAMAKAGQVHLPGRGFLYRVPVEKGMFNLPSIMAHHQYQANMQQIINAIDNLNGHTHWRDQEVFSVGDEGRGAGLQFLEKTEHTHARTQVCQQAIVRRDQSDLMIDLFIESGIAGINVNHVRRELGVGDSDSHAIGTNAEYSLLRCVLDEGDAIAVAARVAERAAQAGLQDICLFRQPVYEVATYTPGATEFRSKSADSQTL
ncbi:MAG: hypothetical protein AAGG55_00915 [Pseudomonadota bacterium]